MSSGVSVQPSCVETFNELKIGHKFRYILYGFTENLKEITVLKTAPPSATYDDFREELSDSEERKEGRYGVFDADFELKNGSKRSKIVLVLWSPDGATIKQKMLYTSSKDYIKRALIGIGKDVQANDQGDLEWTNVLEILRRN